VQPFASLTVRENIAVGSHLSRPRADALPPPAMLRARWIGRTARPAGATLTVGGRKRLELARARDRAAALLPTRCWPASTLPNPRYGADHPRIRDRGITIVMIEHVMQAVMSLADMCLSCPRDASLRKARAVRSRDPRVVEAYLGAARPAGWRQREPPMPEPILAVNGLHAGYAATEILGA
jgi:branched-chain amino acid transport system ATP-binding protein